MKLIKVLFVVFSLNMSVNAQFLIEWEQTFDSGKNDWGESLYFDNDGNIIVAGTSLGDDFFPNALIVKYNPDGQLLWSKTYDIGDNDKPIGVFFDSQNNIYMGVTGNDSSAYTEDFHFVKYSADGDLLIGKRIAWYVPSYDSSYYFDVISSTLEKSLSKDNYNNFTVVGTGPYPDNFWSVRLDSQGDFISRNIDTVAALTGYYPYSSKAFFNPSNAYAYLGCLFMGGNGDTHYGIIQFDNGGFVQSYKRLFSFGNKYMYATLLDFEVNNSGQIYLALEIQNQNVYTDSVNYFSRVACVAPDGSLVWDNVFEASVGFELQTNVYAISLDAGGNIWATGTKDNSAFIAKLSGAGETTWMNIVDFPWSGGQAIACDGRDGAFAFMTETADIWIYKYDQFGNKTTQFYIDGISVYTPAYLNDMKFDEDRFLITTGSEYASTWNAKTRKIFDQATDIENEDLPTEFSLSQNYPNPFSPKFANGGGTSNPSTTIKFSIPNVIARSETTKQSDEIATQPSVARNDNVRLVVYNSLGQQVAELINKPLSAGNYEVTWDASKVPSGIYFYRLQSGAFVETKKMILLK